MPAIVTGPPPRTEQMWQALKTHITRERQRKKQGMIFTTNCKHLSTVMSILKNSQKLF